MPKRKKPRKQSVGQEKQENRLFQSKLLAQLEPTKYRIRRERLWLLIGVVFIFLGLVFIINGLSGILNKSKQEVLPETAETFTPTETPGKIDEGASTARVEAAGLTALEKADQTAEQIQTSGRWRATDYERGDIGVGAYQVKLGDTLWEIAEAVYGNGFLWTKILEINQTNIGFLPNGSQALIIPGQVLIIPK